MHEYIIENHISNVLFGNAKENAFNFTAFLRENGMLIEKFTYHGEDTLHWEVKYMDALVCYVLLDAENNGWTIMPDNSSTGRFADYPIDEAMKETAWKNLNICVDGRCGGCEQGTGKRQMVFGKEIENVCPMAYNFTNPDTQALELAIKMMDVRKHDIVKSHYVERISPLDREKWQGYEFPFHYISHNYYDVEINRSNKGLMYHL